MAIVGRGRSHCFGGSAVLIPPALTNIILYCVSELAKLQMSSRLVERQSRV